MFCVCSRGTNLFWFLCLLMLWEKCTHLLSGACVVDSRYSNREDMIAHVVSSLLSHTLPAIAIQKNDQRIKAVVHLILIPPYCEPNFPTLGIDCDHGSHTGSSLRRLSLELIQSGQKFFSSEGWTDGSAVKNTGCSSRGPESS
ncbi:hypothetical protein STEG23_015400 [Scotinomys teguina]